MTTERQQEVVEQLRGTCLDLNTVLSDEEQNDDQMLSAVDDALFCCSRCSWWCDWDELKEGLEGDDEPVCEDCAD